MNVAIIKYNAGNIFSVDYALRRLGIEPVITSDKELIRKADKVIFPGVGEAQNTMEYLRAHQLDQLITGLKQPVLGICLGMQCMVIEFARNVLGLAEANSTEMDTKTPYNVIDLMEEQKSISSMGGTMRLGAYQCRLLSGSKVAKAYGTTDIMERHRHRFEFNNEYRAQFEAAGMHCVGENPEAHLVEVVELEGKKWYIGTQYHPEYSSTVLNPHPLFMDFVRVAIENKKNK